MSFDYTMSADPSAAIAASKQVEDSLVKVENRAKSAGDAMTKGFALKNAAGDFLGTSVLAQQLGDRVRGAASAAEAFTARLKANSAALGENKVGAWDLSRSFEAMAAGLKRNQDVLERIRGPEREHAANMRSLEMLYRQGAISAREYATEVERAARAKAAGAGPGVGSGMLQGVGLGVLQGGAAGVAAMATGAVVNAARDVIQLGEAYGNLDNRLKKLAPLESDRLALMERTRAVANDARADWSATNETFVRLTNATKDMGLTQARTLDLTSTISKAFAQSGASAEESASGMLQLTQAFASGKLQGDEFKSLAESVPDVLNYVAQAMGVSRGELKALAADGKITGDVLVRAFELAKDSIDAGFAKTTPSLSQSFAVFRNEMTATFGPLIQSFLPAVAAAMTKIAGLVKDIADGVANAKSLVDKVGGAGAGGVTVGDVAGGLKDGFGKATSFLNPTFLSNEIAGSLDGSKTRAQEEALLKFQGTNREAKKIYEEMEASGESWIQVMIRQGQALDMVAIQLTNFLNENAKLTNTFSEADAKGKTLGKTIGEVAVSFDPWGDKGSEAAQKIKGELDKLVGSFSFLGEIANDVKSTFTDLADQTTWDRVQAGVSDFLKKAKEDRDKSVAFIGFDDAPKGGGLSAYAEMLKAIKGPQLEFNKNTAALSQLLKNGKITVAEYDAQLIKLIETFKGKGSSDWRVMETTSEYELAVDRVLKKLGLLIKAQSEVTVMGAKITTPEDIAAEDKAANDAAVARMNAGFERQERNKVRAGFGGKNADGSRAGFNAADGADKNVAADEYTKSWLKEMETLKEKSAEIDALAKNTISNFGDAMVESAMKGKLSFESFFQSLESSLLKFAANKLLMSLLGGLGGTGGTASIFNTGATQAFSGMFGSADGGAHARGGSYRVGGSGGPDSQNVMFRLTPGEQVTFTPRGDSPGGGGGGNVEIHNTYDDAALLSTMQTRAGARVIHNTYGRKQRGRSTRWKR